MSKRKVEDIVAYVKNVSPQKRNKSFNIRLQTADTVVKAICFDPVKHDKIVNARLSGEAVKFQKIINQTQDIKVSHYADYIINSSTSIKEVDQGSVTFKQKENEGKCISLSETPRMGTLVSIKGKVILRHSTERDVIVGMRTVKVLNNGFIFNETGSIALTLWDEWIPYIKNNIQDGNCYFHFRDLLVRDSLGEIILSSCSDTECQPISDENFSGVEFEPDAEYLESISEIDAVHMLNFGLKCSKCTKIITPKCDDSNVINCENCHVTLRVSKLEKSYQAVIESSNLGTNSLYKINLTEIQSLRTRLSFEMDKLELREKLMALTNINVKVNQKEKELQVLNGDEL